MMNRKEFIGKSIALAIGCCGAASTLAAKAAAGIGADAKGEGGDPKGTDEAGGWIGEFEKRMIKGSESPAWHKAEKGERWIKDLMDNMDAILDDSTKKTLMQACGRSCYIGAFGEASSWKPPREEAERFIKFFEDNGSEVSREGGAVTIVYSWGRDHQNPWGLIMSDGYCMCPLVENGPPDLSGSFCFCSSGYVKEIFERGTGMSASVEVLDSLKRGGKDCIFRITLREA